MDERNRIIEDLKRWLRQQRIDGVERVYLDRELQVGSPVLAAAAAARGGSDPESLSEDVELSAAAAADGRRAPKGDDLFAAIAPEQSGRPMAELDVGRIAELEARHPQWGDSELMPLAREVEACRACGLGAQRNCSVPGMGNPRAKLAFVGEAPGAEEDRLGLPFVGRAGQLLDKILAAIDLKREDVHILNILKCRPPENRNPAPDEIEACRPFLERQIDIIQPRLLVALGLFAGQWLTGKKMSLTKLRETGPFEYRGIPVYATYHTAALLRNPNWKKPAWEDFKIIRREYDKL